MRADLRRRSECRRGTFDPVADNPGERGPNAAGLIAAESGHGIGAKVEIIKCKPC